MTQCGVHGSMEYVKQLEAERDALQAQLCAARDFFVKHCPYCGGQGFTVRIETGEEHDPNCQGDCSNYGCPVPVPIQVQEQCQFCAEVYALSSSPCRHAEDSKRLNQSMDTIHAVSENRRKMFEDAHNALTRIYEKLDREKVRVVIKHDAWAITSHDDPFILYQQGNMSKGKLCEYIASAIISYLKESP